MFPYCFLMFSLLFPYAFIICLFPYVFIMFLDVSSFVHYVSLFVFMFHYAHMLIVVAFLVVNFFSFLVIAPSH